MPPSAAAAGRSRSREGSAAAASRPRHNPQSAGSVCLIRRSTSIIIIIIMDANAKEVRTFSRSNAHAAIVARAGTRDLHFNRPDTTLSACGARAP